MAAHPDLAAEQAHIDRAYARLDAMRAAAAESLQVALELGQGGGPYQTLVERDVMVANSVQRIGQLEIGGEALCFGRIDRQTGEAFHIGRLGVSDEDHEPLVVDWRAPAAEPFYRATGKEPLGLTRRRHFLVEGRELVDIEDELFGGDGELGLAGSGALVAALERSRTGRMRDIVATVQREQDEIIRGPMAGVLVVQGGPGTGKTAVALHRAAYLLYTFRFPLERQGVLVVGPNRLFMRYIEHVLPSLGENGVELSTIGGLVSGARPSGPEPSPAVARLKGDVRMAAVLGRAVKDRQRPLKSDIVVGYGSLRLRVSAAATADIVRVARRRPGPHNARRPLVERLLWQRLHDSYVAATARNRRVALRPLPDGADTGGAGERSDDGLTAAELGKAVRRDPVVVEALERMWPVLTPAQLLRDLFGASSLLRLAGEGVLSADEIRSLSRDRGESVDDVAWTDADMPLLDEAMALLGSRKKRSAVAPPEGATGDGGDGDIRTYGHIVVDEAQDLTPMQLRMLARRSLNGSMTLVGDVAQATGTWAPSSWASVLEHLPTRRGANTVTLSVNYRTPSEIMDVAGRVLAAAIPGATPPESVRSTGELPRSVFVGGGGAALSDEVARVAASESSTVGGGTVAVVCVASMVESVRSALGRAGIDFGEPATRGLDAPVTLVPVDVVKGLEFDSVVVVEPSAIVAESFNGLQALYVSLTRATKRLTVVHSSPLPPELGSL
jgi:DNA helicase IV